LPVPLFVFRLNENLARESPLAGVPRGGVSGTLLAFLLALMDDVLLRAPAKEIHGRGKGSPGPALAGGAERRGPPSWRAERLLRLLIAGEWPCSEVEPRELSADHLQLVLRASFVEPVDDISAVRLRTIDHDAVSAAFRCHAHRQRSFPQSSF